MFYRGGEALKKELGRGRFLWNACRLRVTSSPNNAVLSRNVPVVPRMATPPRMFNEKKQSRRLWSVNSDGGMYSENAKQDQVLKELDKIRKEIDTQQYDTQEMKRQLQALRQKVESAFKNCGKEMWKEVKSRPYDKTCQDISKCTTCQKLPSSCSSSSQCPQKDVVYSIKCDLCPGEKGLYIGDTSRPLAERFQEHYRYAANPKAKSYKFRAFSKHYRLCHPGQKPKLTAKVLEKTRGSLERKTIEALYIQRIKPDLNG